MQDPHQILEITLHLAGILKRDSLFLSLKRTLNQNTKEIFRTRIILVSNQTSKQSSILIDPKKLHYPIQVP
jgi:hypothetical protein